MEALKVIWRSDSLRFLKITSAWYEVRMGYRAAASFTQGIEETVKTLSCSPQIGTHDECRSTDKTKYYSFLSHPKYRIIYRFTKTTLYIVAIHATMMKHN